MKREKKNDCALRLCGTQGFDAICQLVSFLGRSCQSDCVSVWTLDTSAAAAATKFVFFNPVIRTGLDLLLWHVLGRPHQRGCIH